MLRELVLTAPASLLVGICSTQFLELPYQMETRQEIAPVLSKYRTEHHALFAQLVSMAEGMGKRKKSNFFVVFFSFSVKKDHHSKERFLQESRISLESRLYKDLGKNSKRLFYAFQSFYEPSLVLRFLCPKLAHTCRLSKYKFCCYFTATDAHTGSLPNSKLH